MWIRDLLPEAAGFRQARIMTFGYSSAHRDKMKFNEELEDYAIDLFRQPFRVREEAGIHRPLIIIAHSMGGIVARLAITSIHTLIKEFEEVNPGQIGLLFLSTTHLGSRQVDYSDFWVGLSESFGARSEIIDSLKIMTPRMNRVSK